MNGIFRLPSPAMAVSLAALTVALAGTSYAAVSLQANSVGTKQLKNGAVTGSKIASGAITASKVKTDSLRASDFAPGQLHPIAYAAVNANGTLDTAHTSSNIKAPMVSLHATSAYCFSSLPFSVKSALAVVEYNATTTSTNDQQVSISLAPASSFDCPAGTRVEVAGQSGGTWGRVPFVIWFY